MKIFTAGKDLVKRGRDHENHQEIYHKSKGCVSNYYHRNSPHLHGNMPAPWNDDPLPEHLLQQNLHDTDSLEVAYTHYA